MYMFASFWMALRDFFSARRRRDVVVDVAVASPSLDVQRLLEPLEWWSMVTVLFDEHSFAREQGRSVIEME